MAVGPHNAPNIPAIAGFKMATAAAGIRYQDREDLTVLSWPEHAAVATAFTRNRFCAAPVIVAREHLAAAHPVAAIINAGNANAGTGQQGIDACRVTCKLAAQALGCDANQVLPYSTGVISQALPTEPFAKALPGCVAALAEDQWTAAANAILTTDTRNKMAMRQLQLDGVEQPITIAGFSKGSGMIRPDMATMLAYVATDASIANDAFQPLLTAAVEASFNCITVDGDTSTNDAILAVATGDGAALSGTNLERFQAALTEVCVELAQAIVRDGEGATKFISIEVEGAASVKDAYAVADTVAHSPLVKTALFASDANWGRILAAVGRAPVSAMEMDRLNIWLGDVALIANGEPAPGYTEEQGAAVVAKEDISIRIDLGLGDSQQTIWTCDLSHEYVSINADYRS